MASKYQLSSNNIYIEGTSIPKNRFDIKDELQIHEIEKELLEEAYIIFYDDLDEDTIFDETYFIQLHNRTFSAIYEFAGVYRDFNMSKGDSRFCQGEFVDSSSKKIFEELKNDNYLKNYDNISKEIFAQKLAYYKCELIALHPFYELNGRITRLFLDMIAVYNGYKYIDYSKVLPKQYIEASIECVQFADCDKMQEIIYNGLSKKN